MEEIRRAEADEQFKDHIRLLHNILGSYQDTVDAQAKRKPTLHMTPKEIRTINEILRELQEAFQGTDAEDYLHLAEEPDEEDRENHPGTTYGEMSLLLSAFQWSISAFQYGNLYLKNTESDGKE